MLSYGYGLGSSSNSRQEQAPAIPGSSNSTTTAVYVVLSTLEYRPRAKRNHHSPPQAECVYTNQEMAYSHALARALEDGSACLDDDGVERLSRIARDMAALSMPFRESWRRAHDFLEAEKARLDWDVWPRCWVQETQLSVRRESGGPARLVEGLGYLFSDEAAPESEDEEEHSERDGGGKEKYQEEREEDAGASGVVTSENV